MSSAISAPWSESDRQIESVAMSLSPRAAGADLPTVEQWLPALITRRW